MRDPPPLHSSAQKTTGEHAYLGQHSLKNGASHSEQQNSSPSWTQASDIFEFSDYYGAADDEQYKTTTNDTPEYRIPHFGTGSPGTIQYDQQNASVLPRFAARNANAAHSPRGTANSVDFSNVAAQRLETYRGRSQPPSEPQTQYNASPPPLHSDNNFDVRPPLMHSSAYSPLSYSNVNAIFTHVPNSSPISQHYTPFQGLFSSCEDARRYRKDATRFDRTPYRPPDSDHSIDEIAGNESFYVKKIYDAMIRDDAAQDNHNSIAMRRWVHSAFYPAELVEAYAHKIYDCLIRQVREGYRGWHHNDYASDDRKGEPEDKNVSCAERLENIILALEEEKTICEDVMTSECQIRMFVNAPRAYAQRKKANRQGNSKRGKSKESVTKLDPRARVSKQSKRASTRQTSVPPRIQQETPYAPDNRDTSRILQGLDMGLQNQLPYFIPATSQPFPMSSPSVNQSAPQQTPAIPHSEFRTPCQDNTPLSRRVTPISFPQLQTHASVNAPHFTASVPLGEQSSFMSPQFFSHIANSAPATPDEPIRVNTLNISYQNMRDFGRPSDSTFQQEGAPWELDFMHLDDSQSPMDPVAHALPEALPICESNIDPVFRDYWNNQHDVQPFPQLSSTDQ